MIMARRDPKHAAREQLAFEVFLRAHPGFAATVQSWRQPEADFPDVVVTLSTGEDIDFEIGEWIHGEQFAKAKQREAVVAAIEAAIGPQGDHKSSHFGYVMLFPRATAHRFEPADGPRLRQELWELIDDTERRWPTERFWQDPQGRHVADFTAHRTLGTYVDRIVFDPLIVAGRRRTHPPSGLPWIVSDAPGGAYAPGDVLGALRRLLQGKAEHYAGLTRQTRLLAYYGRAIRYNTPWHGPGTKAFADVAEIAASVVADQRTFERIYVLSMLEPALEAFQIFPRRAILD
jgi:hypothetical protein